LDRVLGQAERDSADIAIAVARIREAQANVRIAQAALLPEVILGADASRQGSSAGSIGSFGANLNASYEVDFWGGNRASRDSAVALLHATQFERDTVRLTVTAIVAGAWMNAVALRERIGIAERNLRTAERLLALVESRERAGAGSPLELAQQRGLIASQRRSVVALRQQSDDARTALGVLLAQAGNIRIGLTSLRPLRVPAVGAGIPSELLARRPDLARAEAQLAAADANVAVARAAMLPRLSLAGGVGVRGEELRRVLDNPVNSLLVDLAVPIFNAGRLAAGRDVTLAQREALLASYRQAIVAAIADVEVALNAVTSLHRQARLQAEELAQAERALTLAESRYRAGAETLLTLLDAQRSLYAAQDIAVQLKLARLLASVSLYRALGGGWSSRSATLADRTENGRAT
jgi:NodT family efflux transporter outer membrane factor (OMF) lipoprotein